MAAKDSWRQERGYAGRRPGNAAFNLSRFVVLRRVVQEADAGAAQQLTAEVEKVSAMVTALGTDRHQTATEAASAAAVAERVAVRLNGMTFDPAMTLRLMKGISGEAEGLAEQGERAAEQATMALDSLFVAYTQNAKLANEQQVRAAINGLFQQLEDPSEYNGFRFARDLKNVNSLLP